MPLLAAYGLQRKAYGIEEHGVVEYGRSNFYNIDYRSESEKPKYVPEFEPGLLIQNAIALSLAHSLLHNLTVTYSGGHFANNTGPLGLNLRSERLNT